MIWLWCMDLYQETYFLIFDSFENCEAKLPLTLRRPLRRKLWMKCFFDVSNVKESNFFFIRTSLTFPPPKFLMRIFWKIPIQALPDFFFKWFLYQDLFWVRWFYSLFERMRLKRKKLHYLKNEWYGIINI